MDQGFATQYDIGAARVASAELIAAWGARVRAVRAREVEVTWTLGAKLLGLAVAVAVGVALAQAKLVRTREAIPALNAYALYVAFPALIGVGVARAGAAQVGSAQEPWAGYALWPMALALTLGLLRVAAPVAWRGVWGLVLSFGNVAYLGLPLAWSLFDEASQGMIARVVAWHVALAVVIGPWAIERGGPRAAGEALAQPARWWRQPLVWAPLAGWASHGLSDQARQGLLELASPLASSAAPVALVMLGMYLHQERGQLRRPPRAVWAAVALRLMWAPLLVWAMGAGMVRWGMLSEVMWRAHVLLAMMPAAITTFAIAQRQADEQAQQLVAATIVWSTLCAPLVWGLMRWAGAL